MKGEQTTAGDASVLLGLQLAADDAATRVRLLQTLKTLAGGLAWFVGALERGEQPTPEMLRTLREQLEKIRDTASQEHERTVEGARELDSLIALASTPNGTPQ